MRPSNAHGQCSVAVPPGNGTYVTDGRTNGEPPHLDMDGGSASVSRGRAYDDDDPWFDDLSAAVDALEAARDRAAIVRRGDRLEIHPWVRRAIYKRDHFRCCWCTTGAPVLHLDHIVPWSAGGSDASDNLRTLCAECNEGRSNYITDIYARRTPVGICDRCAGVGDDEPRPIFCGRCNRTTTTSNRRRIW